MNRDTPFPALAVVPPGLEDPTAAELEALGADQVRILRRAVAFQGTSRHFYRVLLRARLPFRLLRQLARFPCRSRSDLQEGVQRAADWEQWLPPRLRFKVEVSGGAPGLSHSHFTALQVKNALVDWQRQRWGERSSVDLEQPDLVVHLHLGRGEAVLSLDGSGSSLHRRGYRAAMGLAPLKENLAAGLISLTGWDGRVPLIDPLCGSGTLLIEAAAMVLGHAPGLDSAGKARGFALRHWADFRGDLWDQEVAAARDLARSDLADGTPLAPLIGMDRDPDVLAQARGNAAEAGLSEAIRWQAGDLRELRPPATASGLLVCNPPYGERVGSEDDLAALYGDLGRVVRERFRGWTLWLLSGNPELTGSLRLKASRRIPISNGGIDCRWLRYDIRH